ncbi:MAG: archaeosine biosynthesis radical SAM protein RaSEA [Candidatus Nealsonbacteria bacterium]
MLSLQILPFLLQVVNKTLGEKPATNLLHLIVKNQKFFYFDKIYDFSEKKTISRITLLLPSKGCEWAKKTGGCTMCAFGKKAYETGKDFSVRDLLALYEISVNLTESKHPLNLAIYNGGSFLNDNEIPIEAQLKICQKVKNHHSIKKLFVESRVEFVTRQGIKNLKIKLNGKTLMIGIGLEAQDDKIRNSFIRKGLTKKDYESTIKLLRENEVRVLTYVFLKPIHLTEKQAVEEAIKTIEYAFRVGTDEVALESAFIQEGTPMAKLFHENKFKPPWLWSIIEVIKKTSNLGPIYIGGFEDEPSPIAIPSNCSSCSSKIKNLLQQYRETCNINLFNNIECNCYKLWKKEMEVKS